MQRFVWDLMYPNPPSDNYDLPISAIYKNTPFVPEGPAVMPGKYVVKLTANGHTLTQTLTVRMDPRLTTPAAGLLQQFTLSMQAYNAINRSQTITEEAKKLGDQLKAVGAKAANDSSIAKDIDALTQKLAQFGGGGRGRGPGGGAPDAAGGISLTRVSGVASSLLALLQEADVAPTTQAVAATTAMQADFTKAELAWKTILKVDIPAINAKLKAANISQIESGAK